VISCRGPSLPARQFTFFFPDSLHRFAPTSSSLIAFPRRSPPTALEVFRLARSFFPRWFVASFPIYPPLDPMFFRGSSPLSPLPTRFFLQPLLNSTYYSYDLVPLFRHISVSLGSPPFSRIVAEVLSCVRASFMSSEVSAVSTASSICFFY